MNKILNYIVNGKGIGALLLLGFAFIVAVYISISAKFLLTDSIPHMQGIADTVLPIKIENGQVVEPANTIKEINLFGNNQSTFPFVIDTTKDTIDTKELPEGVYLSRSYLYSISKLKADATKLTGNVYLPQQDYTPLFKSAIKWMVVVVTLVGSVFFFLGYLILTLFYAFCATLASVINKRELSFDARMRLSTVAFVTTYILSMILGKIGLSVNLLLFFFIVLVVQILIVKKLPQ